MTMTDNKPGVFTITVMPMLFVYNDFYPSGGWEDFAGYFPTVEQAKVYVDGINMRGMKAHIVDDGKIVLEKFGDDEWEEV